jgi:hypothetical protein
LVVVVILVAVVGSERVVEVQIANPGTRYSNYSSDEKEGVQASSS